MLFLTSDSWRMEALPMAAVIGAASALQVRGGPEDSTRLVLRANATVWCCGSDIHDQLGDGTTGGTTHRRTKAVQVVFP